MKILFCGESFPEARNRLAAHDCNIEVALIDTEGEIAIDVFYLTIGGAKLNQDIQQQLHTALSLAVEELRPAPAGT
jgi:[protein-PII] uridylyltransferase